MAAQTVEFTARVTTYVSASSTTDTQIALSSVNTTCSGHIGALLSTMAVDALETACACLGVPAYTTTMTQYITSVVRSTTTSVEGQAPTTTAFLISRVTVTECATPLPLTMTSSTLKIVTTNSTISLAAPTYDAVWGPAPGCADVSAISAQQLDVSVTDDHEAVGMCQEICTQAPHCKGVLVQQMFPDYNGVLPFFECFLNDKYVNATADMFCGEDEGIYGIASAFDACGRGIA